MSDLTSKPKLDEQIQAKKDMLVLIIQRYYQLITDAERQISFVKERVRDLEILLDSPATDMDLISPYDLELLEQKLTNNTK